MTNIQMPDPVGLTTPENLASVQGGGVARKFWSVSMRAENEVSLYSTTQMEAYADAKVRQALDEAAMILKANAEACHSDTRIMLRANAEAIRALIPKG